MLDGYACVGRLCFMVDMDTHMGYEVNLQVKEI